MEIRKWVLGPAGPTTDAWEMAICLSTAVARLEFQHTHSRFKEVSDSTASGQLCSLGGYINRQERWKWENRTWTCALKHFWPPAKKDQRWAELSGGPSDLTHFFLLSASLWVKCLFGGDMNTNDTAYSTVPFCSLVRRVVKSTEIANEQMRTLIWYEVR